MGVIFEFGINKPIRSTCDVKKTWAQQWVALKDLTIGSSEYNQALQKITDQYTLCGTNPNKPNQSSLDQLRTNEIALSPGSPGEWEMREFILDPGGSGFFTVKRGSELLLRGATQFADARQGDFRHAATFFNEDPAERHAAMERLTQPDPAVKLWLVLLAGLALGSWWTRRGGAAIG